MHWRIWSKALLEWARRLRREALALWFAVRDPRTPLPAKLLCGLIVAYALSPIDLIPDFIPLLGLLDEALLLPGLIWLAIRMLPSELMQQCRGRADDWLGGGGKKPKSWLGAGLILLLWLAAAALAWSVLFHRD